MPLASGKVLNTETEVATAGADAALSNDEGFVATVEAAVRWAQVTIARSAGAVAVSKRCLQLLKRLITENRWVLHEVRLCHAVGLLGIKFIDRAVVRWRGKSE